jgi:hypothetical protein
MSRQALQESVSVNYPTNEASGEWTAAEAGLIDKALNYAAMRLGLAGATRRSEDGRGH